MADVLETITKLINSPPGQLAAGGVLAGIVWKFFERVEAVLTDDTKLEIAVRLLSIRTEKAVSTAPQLIEAVAGRLFGTTLFNYRRIKSSIFGAVLIGLPGFVFALSQFARHLQSGYERVILSALATYVLALISGLFVVSYLGQRLWPLAAAQLPQLTLKAIAVNLASIAILLFLHIKYAENYLMLPRMVAYLSLSWPLLLVMAWFSLRVSRRFDIGFDWFNRHFDIEKKPLQSIGLVAGALVAVGYWVVVIVGRVVG